MKNIWGQSGYCNLKKIIEANITDFALEIHGKEVNLFTTTTGIDETQRKSDFDPTQIKLSDKLGKLLEVRHLIVYLQTNGFIMTNKCMYMIPEKLTYQNSCPDSPSPRMNVFEDYAQFIKDYHNTRIFVAQELTDFIDNGFKTSEDIEREKQDKRYNRERKRGIISMWVAIIVGTSSIIIGVVSSFSSHIEHSFSRKSIIRTENQIHTDPKINSKDKPSINPIMDKTSNQVEKQRNAKQLGK